MAGHRGRKHRHFTVRKTEGTYEDVKEVIKKSHAFCHIETNVKDPHHPSKDQAKDLQL